MNKMLSGILGAIIVIFILIVTVLLMAEHSSHSMPALVDDQVLTANIQYFTGQSP